MAQAVSGGVEALRAAVGGAVHCPDDPGYDEGRKVWNRAPAEALLAIL